MKNTLILGVLMKGNLQLNKSSDILFGNLPNRYPNFYRLLFILPYYTQVS
jgi:hypothetical protein